MSLYWDPNNNQYKRLIQIRPVHRIKDINSERPPKLSTPLDLN
jgi:hypothetical protein